MPDHDGRRMELLGLMVVNGAKRCAAVIGCRIRRVRTRRLNDK